MATVEETINAVIVELERSIVIHGDWTDYDRKRMVAAINGEYREFLRASRRNDEKGPHGMITEARQLAVVCIKYLTCRSNAQI